MLYGILQLLSTVSLDTDDLKYTSGVTYFLCPSLEGCPPWHSISGLGNNSGRYLQWSQERSYCWQAPERWGGEAHGHLPTYDEQHAMSLQQRSLGNKFDVASTPSEEMNGNLSDFDDRSRGHNYSRAESQSRDSPRSQAQQSNGNGHAIGVALFPNMSELTLTDKRAEQEQRARRENLKVSGGAMKPQMGSLRPFPSATTARRGRQNTNGLTPDLEGEWNRSGYFSQS